jgi:nucleoside-diphosphate-sugar epimerase
MKQTFLITGGAGFIGTNLAEFLVNEGYEVIVVDDLSAGDNQKRLPKSVIFHQADVRDTATMIKICVGVDVIVHLAALPSVPFSIENPIVSHDININGTLSTLEAAKQAGVKRVVFASSSAVYGNTETLPHNINMKTDVETPYALHKYVGERMMKMWSELYKLETVSLRFFNVYGPHFDPKGAYAAVIGRLLEQASSNSVLTITGDGKQTRDFVHVSDVAAAITKASQSTKVGKGEVLNVGTGQGVSINKLAEIIGGEVTYIPGRNELKHSRADVSETEEVLNYKPKVSLEAGLEALGKKTIA